MATKRKTTKQQSTNNWGEGNDGDGRRQCKRIGIEEAILSLPETPSLLQGTVMKMSATQVFSGRIGGGFGGGDGQTASSSNNDNGIFNTGNN